MIRIAVLVAIAAAIAAATWFFWPSPPLLPPAAAPAPAVPVPPAGPVHPVPAVDPGPKPLPTLRESDATLLEALIGLAGAGPVANLLFPEDLVRRIVATIDNLPREAYAARLNPARPVPGPMKTTGKGEGLTLAPENAARYEPYVRALEGVEPKRLAATYFRLYPLFQQAYVELGYPNGYFNDRVVEVIDHLLDAPDAETSVALAVPHVLFEYADPDLEALSAGQKLMMRMGPLTESRVKAKLRAIRAELSKNPPAR